MSSCEGPLYSCGITVNWQTAVDNVGVLSQTIDTKRSFMLGATEIIVAKRVRTFTIAVDYGWADENPFLIYNDDGPGLCATINRHMTGSISEDYQYTTTVLHFLDTRYNNAFGVEKVESITFSDGAAEEIEFIGVWGAETFPKFLITNHDRKTTTNYFIVLDGVKTILKTSTETVSIHGPDNPLIIVWPLPPSQGITFDNDVKAFGFYDYNAGGQEMKQRDGGDDFYFTDWMRGIGSANRETDQFAAENRYLSFYLGDAPPPATEQISNPGILFEDLHNGSIARDKDGNIFYSVKFGAEIFNSLTGGDPVALTAIAGTNPAFYPVGII